MKSWQHRSVCLTWYTLVAYSNKFFQRSETGKNTLKQTRPVCKNMIRIEKRETRLIRDIKSHSINNIYIYIHLVYIDHIDLIYNILYILFFENVPLSFVNAMIRYIAPYSNIALHTTHTSHVGQMLPCTHPLRQLPEVGNDDPVEVCSWVRGALRASLW